MSTEDSHTPTQGSQSPSPARCRFELFLVSFLVLYLELALIRWFPAHVLFLTFFTNVVLLASFLGMSVGCLAAQRRSNLLLWSPPILALGMAGAHLLENWRVPVQKLVSVGTPRSPQLVFFGTEYITPDPAGFFLPVEVVGGVFFLLIAMAMIGPGQELGRALTRLPNRVEAYSFNILGSVAGILAFASGSWWELPPFWWFLVVLLLTAYFLMARRIVVHAVALGFVGVTLLAVLGLASLKSGRYTENGQDAGVRLWSPYYRVDYDSREKSMTVNLIVAHQQMVRRDDDSSPAFAYALPYLLNRDSGGSPFEDVLIIGAGTGNDVSRALQWGAKHVDAVEIDPVIQRLGRDFHPDRPYQDGRVHVHLDDGRNFLRSPERHYDLILYALVDSLVLHSSYSNIRLESYLFTRQAFEDVRRSLKPGGQFVVYNYFRQGWIVARIFRSLQEAFGHAPLVVTLPPRPVIEPQSSGGFTVFFIGGIERLRTAFRLHAEYLLPATEAPHPNSPNGFAQPPGAVDTTRCQRFAPSEVKVAPDIRAATDDWPFLYLRRPMIPTLVLRGMAMMGALAFLLIFLFVPRRKTLAGTSRFSPRMFFLGAGFMLIETKAVVHMALLFGSTWMVNSVVFFAVLVMILVSNLFVLRFKPGNLRPYYGGLLASLALNIFVPLDFFLGMNRIAQVASSCLLVFAPVFFAGIVFAVSFRESPAPDRDFGANTAGAMAGGLAENASMLLGFRYLLMIAVGFYLLSAILHRSPSRPHAREA
jgi:spermidine synthase